MADTEGVYKQIAEQVSFEEDDDFEEFETQGRSRAPPDFGDRALPPAPPAVILSSLERRRARKKRELGH